MNKFIINNPKLSLINNIRTPTKYTSKHTLEIADSGANIHISNQATPTMEPVIISKDMTSRLLYGSTMESSHIATLQILGLSKQARQIQI